MHLSVEEKFDFKHFQVLTYHYIKKLGLFTKEEFLSEPKLGFLSSSKSKFRDKNQGFWLAITPRKSNPNFSWNQKTSTAEDQLQIHFSASLTGMI